MIMTNRTASTRSGSVKIKGRKDYSLLEQVDEGSCGRKAMTHGKGYHEDLFK